MLFSFFNPIEYQAKTTGSKKIIPTANIYRDYQEYFDRVAVNYLLQNYYIQGAPRPEELSYELYGNTQFYWILLMCNGIYDPYHGWIKSQDACYQAAEQKYSKVGGNQILYHVDADGNRYYNVEQVPPDSGIWWAKGENDYTKDSHIQYRGALAAVDVYEDAILENEKLRQIKIINPVDIESFLSDIVREMEKAPE
ncbi:baseplate wedge subunit [Klebsiella phage Kpn BM7]|uniref:Baseplate wedge subunit n=1 Tax=Klebsiella phage AmPh_EK29 TaxID=2653641 RepID=A0A5P8PKD6_9CAUD|nr:baseplate wedge subunit [Klebsiella phage AmPh_EK29]WLJ69971.1 baseplate wedge subunit [Klebsiella phage Kpn BM7]